MTWRRAVARCFLLLLALVVSAAGLLLGWRLFRQTQIRHATRIDSTAGIASLERVQLGGVEQSILIRGQNRGNPLVLVLHGGPGVPDMPFEFVNAALEQNCTVVQWDQRGAGKSYSDDLPPDALTVEKIVADAEQLIDQLRPRFHQSQVVLVGHSTGTVIGVLLAQRRPETIRAYVGISQVADLPASEKILYDFALRAAHSANDRKATTGLEKIGPPPFPSPHEIQVSQKWVNHFAPDPYGALGLERIKLTWISPAYSLLDLWRLTRGAEFSFKTLWRQFFALNLFQRAPRLEVPVFFLLGRDDHVVTAQVAERYFQALDAPRGKELIWFEHSAHWPQLQEPEKFRRVLIERVLASTPASR